MNHANHKLRRFLPLLALAGAFLLASAAHPAKPAAPHAPAAVASGLPVTEPARLPLAVDPASAALAGQLQQARWQVEALHTLIDQAEAT